MIDAKTVLEIACLIISVLSSTAFLASRIQKIEDVATATNEALKEHIADDKDEFRRVYDRLDRKQDRSAALHTVA